MTLDLTQLTGGQIAFITATATLLAAILAGSAAVVVAIINTRSSRELSKQTARREYYQRTLEPFLQRIEDDIPRLIELNQCIAKLVIYPDFAGTPAGEMMRPDDSRGIL